jgi:hypothetical protein
MPTPGDLQKPKRCLGQDAMSAMKRGYKWHLGVFERSMSAKIFTK